MAPTLSSPQPSPSSLFSLCPHFPFPTALQISPPRLPARVCFHWPGLPLCLPGSEPRVRSLFSARKVWGGVPPVPQTGHSLRGVGSVPSNPPLGPSFWREGCGWETSKEGTPLLCEVKVDTAQLSSALGELPDTHLAPRGGERSSTSLSA